jgi:biotin operon repressor
MNEKGFYSQFHKDFLFVTDVISKDLSLSEIQVYTRFIRRSWAVNQDFVRISLKELARESGLSHKNIRNALKTLRQKGLLRIVSDYTSTTSKSYRVPRPAELGNYQPSLNQGVTRDHPIEIDLEEEKAPFISQRLDKEDEEMLISLLGTLSPERRHDYKLKAEEILRENGVDLDHQVVQAQIMDLVLLENFGPGRLEKYL